MEDKLSPGQFHSIYSGLTGGCSVTDNIKWKEMGECMRSIIKTVHPGILRGVELTILVKLSLITFVT